MDFILPIVISLSGGFGLYFVFQYLSYLVSSKEFGKISKDGYRKGDIEPSINQGKQFDEIEGPSLSEPVESTYIPEYDEEVMYVWAAQGPFESGAFSSLAMTNSVLVVLGEARLKECVAFILSHENIYNDDPEIWEEKRKKTVQDSAKKFGSRFNDFVKQAESLRKDEVSSENGVVAYIIKNLSYASPKVLSSSLSIGGEEKDLQVESCTVKDDFSSDCQPGRQKSFQPGRAKSDFISDVGGCFNFFTFIIVFFVSWGALIAGNIVLGIAFGWIPALIVAFMAAALLPLVLTLLFILAALIAVVILVVGLVSQL